MCKSQPTCCSSLSCGYVAHPFYPFSMMYIVSAPLLRALVIVWPTHDDGPTIASSSLSSSPPLGHPIQSPSYWAFQFCRRSIEDASSCSRHVECGPIDSSQRSCMIGARCNGRARPERLARRQIARAMFYCPWSNKN